MNKCHFTSALLWLFGVIALHGQVNLTEMDIASVDSLLKSKITYFAPGDGGRNKLWDFSKALRSKESSKVMFREHRGTDSVLIYKEKRGKMEHINNNCQF